jgi:hypothetical protein
LRGIWSQHNKVADVAMTDVSLLVKLPSQLSFFATVLNTVLLFLSPDLAIHVCAYVYRHLRACL